VPRGTWRPGAATRTRFGSCWVWGRRSMALGVCWAGGLGPPRWWRRMKSGGWTDWLRRRLGGGGWSWLLCPKLCFISGTLVLEDGVDDGSPSFCVTTRTHLEPLLSPLPCSRCGDRALFLCRMASVVCRRKTSGTVTRVNSSLQNKLPIFSLHRLMAASACRPNTNKDGRRPRRALP